MSGAAEEVKNHLIKARDLAILACNYDENNNLIQAIQSYDEAIIFIDEVLSKIPITCDAYQLLMIYREKYSNRMEQIRYIEIALRDSIGSSVGTIQNKPKRRMSKVPFNDKMNPKSLNIEPREEPPSSSMLRPYWLLRVLRKVILNGGYLSQKLFVPKLVWSQYGVKFTGLSAKTSAFEQLLISVRSRVFLAEPLVSDTDGSANTLTELKSLSRDLAQLQNNLSKPLPYIREITINKENTSSPARTSNVGRLSNMVSNIGKNVFKYAEVSYQRIGASLPTRMDDEDLGNFATLAADLCDKCQILCHWSLDVETEYKSLKETPNSQNDYHLKHRLLVLEEVLSELQIISCFIRDVVCEILLRDTEFLLERYMRKMRKSFSRMYWDDEAEDR